MPLRIGFDLDGVFADMEGELSRQSALLFGEAGKRSKPPSSSPSSATPSSSDNQPIRQGGQEGAPAAGPSDSGDTGVPALPGIDDELPLPKLALTSRQQRQLWRHVGAIENFWETLEEIEPGSIARLAQVAAERGWEIIFLTKRPRTAGVTAQVQSQRWLQSRGFPIPSVFVVQGSRGKIAAAIDLDVVVDDRPENCLDVVTDSKARPILVSRDESDQISLVARRVGIGLVKSVGECLDLLIQADSPAPEQGVLDRVLRLLKLKEPHPTV
jgi:hypothetical protein